MTKRNYLSLLLSFIWMSVIFWFSAQDATESNAQSDGVISLLFFLPPLDEEMLHLVTVLVRKAGHFSEYALLGVLLYSSFYSENTEIRVPLATAGSCAMLYAATDELHQVFVPGRAGRLIDVAIDTLGAITGIAVAAIVFAFCSRRLAAKKDVRY